MSEPYRQNQTDVRVVLDLAHEALALLDARGHVLHANRAFHECFQTTPREILARPLPEVAAGVWALPPLETVLQRVSDGEAVVHGEEVDHVFPRLGRRVLVPSARRLGAGPVTHVLLAVEDRTELRLAEEERRESEERFEKFFDNAAVGMVQADVETGRYLRVNEAMCRITGYSREELLARSGRDLVHPDDREQNWRAFQAAMRQDTPRYRAERRLIRKDGEMIWVRVHAGLAHGRPGEPPRTAAVIEDITAHKLAGQELRELNATLEERVAKRTHQLAMMNEALTAEVQERQRAERARAELLKRVATVQEEERGRIARELHDHLGQLLTALSLKLKRVEEAATDHPDQHELLRRARSLADQIGREVHDLALALRPTALDDVGLAEALASYAQTWSGRAQVDVDFHSEGLYRRLPEELETTLYRVVQEALNNVVKHAAARRVSLLLEQRDGHVVAIVEDDGRGFRANRLQRSSDARNRLGLLSMEERLEAVGGSLEIESTPGKGTTVYARVPFTAREESSA